LIALLPMLPARQLPLRSNRLSSTPIQEKQGTQGCVAKIGAADDKVRTRVHTRLHAQIESVQVATLPAVYLAMRTLVFSLPLSYRQAEMVSERGWVIHHQRFFGGCSNMERNWRSCRLYLRLTNDSWRVDETCIEVKGKQKYLYRAVDSAGQTPGFGWLLSGYAAANAFPQSLQSFHTQ